MTGETRAFLSWCDKFGNSPDVINLRWWGANRRLIQYTPAEERAMLSEVAALKCPPLIIPATVENNEEEIGDMLTRKRDAKGKPAAGTLLKELDPNTIQGKIVEFVLTQSPSVDAALDEFMLERHSLLTHLNVMSRTTGIGYSVSKDTIRLTLPQGVIDPFEL